MDIKRTTAGISALTALTMGTVDATTLKEQPIERLEIVANERVEARQIGNIVETTLPWKGEAGITLKVDLGEPTIAEKVKDKRKHEVITETVDFGDGGFKVDILLNEKPDTNRFCYEIEGAENYNFEYQPALTPQEIEEGAERPDDIVGSYAIYHKFLANRTDHKINTSDLTLDKENEMVLSGDYYKKKNSKTGEYEMFKYGIDYATGKVMHIPRPQVWEVNNQASTTEWAELSYNDTEGLCVTARQEFLDNAIYPVRIDPTFGYSSVGSTFQAIGTGNTFGLKSVSPADADGASLDSITWNGYIFSGPSDVKSLLYTYSGSALTFISAQVQNVGTSQTWNVHTYSSPPTLTASTNYALGVITNSGTARMFYDTSGSSFWCSSQSYSSPADCTALGALTTNKYSIYATYTASGGGGPANGIAVPAVITY